MQQDGEDSQMIQWLQRVVLRKNVDKPKHKDPNAITIAGRFKMTFSHPDVKVHFVGVW